MQACIHEVCQLRQVRENKNKKISRFLDGLCYSIDMNRNGYTRSWRDEERLQTLDLPLGIDPWDPAYQRNPEAYTRDIERMNRAEGRSGYRRNDSGLNYRES